MHLLSALGFILNLEKSQLRPVQDITFIGAVLDAVQGKAFLPQKRVSSIQDCIAVFNVQRTVPARFFFRLLGLMASSVAVTPWARLRMRPIQRHLRQRWSQRRGSLSDPVHITDSLRASLVWWQDARNLGVGVPFVPEEPTLILTTDASLRGWGAFSGSKMVQGLWSEEESRLHISLLELRAVRYALARLLHKVRGSIVLLRMDNTTVVCYVNRQWGTRSPVLCWEAELLWDWALNHQVGLRAVHLAGKDNVLADALSRDLVDPHEWSLNQKVVANIFACWGGARHRPLCIRSECKSPQVLVLKERTSSVSFGRALQQVASRSPLCLSSNLSDLLGNQKTQEQGRTDDPHCAPLAPSGLVPGLVEPPVRTGFSPPALG
ncbi:uncharacterized protein LOC135354803 [Latimeria chalumnae]|uniref:uncharacterized protein LOC135354803 n=1 Tax=Latimeria chalumnae TaxID=7897 RepID=UPI00313DA877